MTSGLAAFFDPRSVAVIGASRDPAKVGGSVLANLRAAGFAGAELHFKWAEAAIFGAVKPAEGGQ